MGVRFSDGTVRATTSPPEAEELRVGDYTVTDELGSEAAGSFFFGEHVLLPRNAAIKITHTGPSYTKQTAIAMLREACLVEALSHPGIPRVYECGVLPDKRPWTAFELVEGQSVATQIAERPMDPSDVIVLVRDVADVLDHIHRRGIVHRAITSEAIISTPSRRFPIFVRHWGEACTLDTAGANVDVRNDIRALGVVAKAALGTAVPPTEIGELFDQMMSVNVQQRPTSAEVRERASFLAGRTFAIRITPRTPTR